MQDGFPISVDHILKNHPNCHIDLHIVKKSCAYATAEFRWPPAIPTKEGKTYEFGLETGPWFGTRYKGNGTVVSVRDDGVVTIDFPEGWTDITDTRWFVAVLRGIYFQWLKLRWNTLSFFGKV